MQVPLLRAGRLAGASRRPGRGIDAGSDRREDRVQPRHDLAVAADHQAETPLETEHPTAGPDVEMVDPRLA